MGIMPRVPMPPFAIDVHQHLWPEPFLPRSSAAPSRRSCAARGDGADARARRRARGAVRPRPARPRPPPRRAAARRDRPRARVPVEPARASRRCPARRRSRSSTPGTTACSRSASRSASGARSRSTARAPRDVDALARPRRGRPLAAGRAFATPGGVRARAAAPRARSRRATRRCSCTRPGGGAGRHAGAAVVAGVRRVRRRAARGLARLRGWARPRLETLRVLFAALAGGAPLHVERLAGARRARARRVRSADLLRHVVLRPARRSRRSAASSASTSSSTARTAR